MPNKIILPVFILFACANLQAQKKDSVAIIREFINVSNAYKTLPLHLVMEYRQGNNLVFPGEDTTVQTGEFYVTQSGSYTHFGEMEQIVNDSTMLIVSNQMQRMIFYTNAREISARAKAMMGMPVPDSSVLHLFQQYRAEKSTASKNDTAIIELRSRTMVNGTELPKELIRIRYNSVTQEPFDVVQIQRSLITMDEGQSDEWYASNKIPIVVNASGKFLLKEQTGIFTYKSIEHRDAIKLPVAISDRISRTDEGNYMPVKAYENYLLSQNE
jgi:hypothetical protein